MSSTDTERYRTAWQSARRRALRRQPHEREGLIFHLERTNKRLLAFVEIANEAAQFHSKEREAMRKERDDAAAKALRDASAWLREFHSEYTAAELLEQRAAAGAPTPAKES